MNTKHAASIFDAILRLRKSDRRFFFKCQSREGTSQLHEIEHGNTLSLGVCTYVYMYVCMSL